MQNAIHIRFFGAVYSAPPCSNISRGIYIRITNITTICTRKVLAFSKRVFLCSNMVTRTARLTGVCRRNSKQPYPATFSLIRQKQPKLVKTPTVEFRFLLLTFGLCSTSYVSQVFNSNAFILFFCFCYYLLANRVVINGYKPALSTTKPFQEFFSPLCAFALNACSYFRIFFPYTFQGGGVKRCAIRHNSYICLSKIYTYKVLNIFNRFVGSFHSLEKIPFTFLKHKISFALDVRYKVFIVADIRHRLPTAYTPYRNGLVFVAKYSTIIRNAASGLKYPLGAFTYFIRIRNFTDTSYNQLRAKIKKRLHNVIGFFVQFKLIKYTLRKGDIRNRIASGICLFKSIVKQYLLIGIWQQFYLQCEFHSIKLVHTFELKKY